jgi:uncharacterized membrane protein YphA (DoxX/SURF4 family)
MSGAAVAALLLVRIVVGATMFAHGLNHWRGGGRIPGTARWFAGLGAPPADHARPAPPGAGRACYGAVTSAARPEASGRQMLRLIQIVWYF